MSTDYYIERGVLISLSDFADKVSITESGFSLFKTHLESLPWFREGVGKNNTEESDEEVSNETGAITDFHDIAGFRGWLKSSAQNVNEIEFIQQVLGQFTTYLEQKTVRVSTHFCGQRSA